jgi:hypothetical protein
MQGELNKIICNTVYLHKKSEICSSSLFHGWRYLQDTKFTEHQIKTNA